MGNIRKYGGPFHHVHDVGLRLCMSDAYGWRVVPDRDSSGRWDFASEGTLHLWRCPHGIEAPLASGRVFPGSVLDSSFGSEDNGSTPVCACCLFHLYPPEIFTMSSLRMTKGSERFELPWRLSVHDNGPTPMRMLLWHVHTHYLPTHQESAPLRHGITTMHTLEEISHLNGWHTRFDPDSGDPDGSRVDLGACAECFYLVFPELVPYTEDTPADDAP